MSKRILVLSDRIGRGDDELGRLLMKNFLYAVARDDSPPSALTLMNDGVRLACSGSDSLEDLRLVVSRGVSVTACGTCLDYLGLKDALEVGEVGTMVGAVASLLSEADVLAVG